MEGKRLKISEIFKRTRDIKYRLIVDSLIVGAVTGIFIVVYRILALKLAGIFNRLYAVASQNIIMIPAVFILLASIAFIISEFVKKEPMISGSGIPQLEGILSRKLSINRGRVLFYKFVGGILCLGAGLSVGREGPSVQMGGCIGEKISKRTKKPDYEEVYLTTCGASAGLSAAFNAPMSGVMFALEEAHKNFSPMILLSAMIASLTADCIAKQFFGIIPSLKFQQLNVMPIKYYWVLIILGIAVGISGVIFNSGILKTQKMFKESKIDKNVKIMIPFILTGIVGMISPILIGGGHELIMELQNRDFILITLVVFLIIKFLLTFICFGSGVPGGIFFPLLVLGALVGNIVGIVSIRYLGIPSIYIMNFVVLAMAGHFAAIVKAPITGIILISEMTSSLVHLLPLAIVTVIAQLTSDILKSEPIYESLLNRLLERSNKTNEYKGASKQKTLLEVSIDMDCLADGKKIKEIKWPETSLIVAVNRGEKEIIPKGDLKLIHGDFITVMTSQDKSPYVLEELKRISTFTYSNEENNKIQI
ncbi:ClC family H(+)/Cl(-) exchange transporter [Peptacetobacter sp.]|uniref:ClC family H(+)/Cl(-) exchange transporter n=1 Tax=Peptacetobacter sp. TaxID=2991975 RepID=UPI002623FB24|nr:ClC family H(+)/Cl(-) exchange transporter [Peptacetobacter sp.]